MLRCWLENPNDRPSFEKLSRRLAVELEVAVAASLATDRRRSQSLSSVAPTATASSNYETAIGSVPAAPSVQAATAVQPTVSDATDGDSSDYSDEEDDDESDEEADDDGLPLL